MLWIALSIVALAAIVDGQTPQPGACYTDKDCMFYNKDSSGKVTGEVVGTCVIRSDTLAMCKCLPAYTGKNCEFSEPPALPISFTDARRLCLTGVQLVSYPTKCRTRLPRDC